MNTDSKILTRYWPMESKNIEQGQHNRDQVGFCLRNASQVNMRKSINVIYHICTIRRGKSIIFSIKSRPAFDKIQYSSLINIPNIAETRNQNNCLNLKKGHWLKSNKDMLNAFLVSSGIRQRHLLSSLLFNTVLEFIALDSVMKYLSYIFKKELWVFH